MLVNGAPYASTGGDLDALPLAAMERIELLGGESLGTFGGGTVRNALNVVLREDWDGTAVRALARVPSRKGGDGYQGSASWGGKVGEGHLSVTADTFTRRHIASADRDYSRGKWTPDGSFADASNISRGGNTVFIAKFDASDEFEGFRSVALGDCDPADGYTGPLSGPPGPGPDTDYGCGFDYTSISWETSDADQQTVLLNAKHPLGDSAEIGVVANFSQFETNFRYAPSTGTFRFVPDADLLAVINDAADGFTADGNDRFYASHRFTGHGNRNWRTKAEAYDITAGVEGRLNSSLGYDAELRLFRQDAAVRGNTFVHEGRAAAEILAGNYYLLDPLNPPADRAEAHRQAILNTSLRQETDFRSESQSLRAALEGSGFSIGGRKAAWTAGVEMGRADAHRFLRFVDRAGAAFDVSDVLGSGGVSWAGKREGLGLFAETLLPVAERVDLRFAGRADELDDVGALRSWRAGAEYRPMDVLTVRGSWSEGELAPGFAQLYGTALQSYPYVECDPGPGPPPRTCASANELQVQRNTVGNPDLGPATAERLAAEAAFRNGPYRLGVEWFRESLSDVPGNPSPDWALRNMPQCAEGVTSDCVRWAGGAVIHDRYANTIEAKTEGITARFGAGFETSWGGYGAYGTWRRETATRLTVDGVPERVVRPKDMLRARISARRGGVRAIWTASYRSGFLNNRGTGRFSPWTGHDLRVDWTNPAGLEGLRITGGVFNLTDENYSIDTANPGSTDGPTVAGWGRTFFLAISTAF